MPTQGPSDAAPPLVYAPDGRGYRLLELPDDFDLTKTWSLVSDSAGLARLRPASGTHGPVYALRQKNTSNALMLLTVQPTAELPSDSLSAVTVSPSQMAIMATLRETVELVEEKSMVGGIASITASGAGPEAASKAPARGKWHERFGRTR